MKLLDNYAVNVLLSSGEYEQEKEYWLTKLKVEDIRSEITPDYKLGKYLDFRADKIQFIFSHEIASKIIKISNNSEYGVFIILLSAVMFILHKYNGNNEILVGTPIFKKSDSDQSSFINSFFPFKCEVDGLSDFIRLVNDVKKTLSEANQNQNYPLENIWKILHAEEDIKTEFFSTVVLMESLHDPSFLEDSKFNNVFCFFKEESELGVTLHYNANLYAEDTMYRVASHISNYLTAALCDAQVKLADIDILSIEERTQLLFDLNDTKVKYTLNKKIHHLFEDAVRRSPYNIALLIDEDKRITYGELNERSNQLARLLMHHGITSGTIVAIIMDRSFEMIIGLLAILKIGGIYVPMEESTPTNRIKSIFLKLGIKHILISTTQNEWISQFIPDLLALERIYVVDINRDDMNEVIQSPLKIKCTKEQLENYTNENVQSEMDVNDNAYIIFTSGSTGEPKGVLVNHNSVVNLIEWVNNTFNVTERDQLFFITSLCFDLSVYDIFGVLAAGGSIRIATREELANPYLIFEILCNESITFWDSAPAALQQILNYAFDERLNLKLRLVFLSGDWIPITMPESIKVIFPQAQIIGLGGATEATIWSNYFPIEKLDSRWGSIPYGKPIQNAQYYILDNYFHPCPMGVSGKLYIGGECLAVGYINDPELTRLKFIANPFVKDTLIYDTGDLARWLTDGNMEFLGRIDNQVKMRGYRIELGEIQMNIVNHPSVQEAIVIGQDDANGNKQLCTYYVANESLNSVELRSFLTNTLPRYMLPSYYVQIEEMPLTANGKVDRKALPIPDRNLSKESVYEAPRNELEAALVEIWQEILAVNHIGISDNFVELGGHSLKATALVSHIYKKLNVHIPLWQMFQAPTIKEMANIIVEKGELV